MNTVTGIVAAVAGVILLGFGIRYWLSQSNFRKGAAFMMYGLSFFIMASPLIVYTKVPLDAREQLTWLAAAVMCAGVVVHWMARKASNHPV